MSIPSQNGFPTPPMFIQQRPSSHPHNYMPHEMQSALMGPSFSRQLSQQQQQQQQQQQPAVNISDSAAGPSTSSLPSGKLEAMNFGGRLFPTSMANSAALLQQQHQVNQQALYSHSPSMNSLQHSPAGGSAVSSGSPSAYVGGSASGLESPATDERHQSESLNTSDPELGAEFTQSFYDPFRIKHRRRTSPPQLKVLEYHFDHNPKPDVTLRKALSEQLDMTPREVQVWFQNRRAKTKKLKEKLDKDHTADDESERTEQEGGGPQGQSIPESQINRDNSMSGQHARFISSESDLLSLRRGSSPAALSIQHYRSGGPIPYYAPRQNSEALSSYTASQNAAPSFANEALSQSAPHRLVTPISLYNNNSVSLSDEGYSSSSPTPATFATTGFHHQPSASGDLQRFQHYDENQHGGRRFSLPGNRSTLPTSNESWSQPKLQVSSLSTMAHSVPFVPFGRQQVTHDPSSVRSYPNMSEANLVSPNDSDLSREFEFGLNRDALEDYSPNSSADDLAGLNDYSYPQIGGHIVDGSARPPTHVMDPHHYVLSQYTFGAARSTDVAPPIVSTSNLYPSGNNSTTSAIAIPSHQYFLGAADGDSLGRRSSCPAGFIPNFNNLGIDSPQATIQPSWPLGGMRETPSTQPGSRSDLHPLQSIPATAGTVPSSSSQTTHDYVSDLKASYTPLGSSPLNANGGIAFSAADFLTAPLYTNSPARRGSTSSPLVTIAEQPPNLQNYTDHSNPSSGLQGERRSSVVARKVRAQGALHTPYDSQGRRSPERRSSVVGSLLEPN